MITAKLTNFDAIERMAKIFMEKSLQATDDVGEEALKIVLERVAKGKTTAGRKMAYRNQNDSFWKGKGKSKRDGDYSSRYINERRRAGKSNSPMDLNTNGGLYKAFRFRKSRTKVSYNLQFFIRKNKSSKHRKDYNTIAGWLTLRFGDIFAPNKQEIKRIGKAWKNRMK